MSITYSTISLIFFSVLQFHVLNWYMCYLLMVKSHCLRIMATCLGELFKSDRSEGTLGDFKVGTKKG